jgi:hypothetical protein
MPIVDRELIRQRIPYDESTIRKFPLGIFIEKAIQKNVLDEQGDGKWLVKIRFSNVLDTNRTCVNWIFIMF